MNNSTKHIELLDYVRAIAIIAVLSFHTLASTYGYEDLPWDGWLRDFSVPASFLCLLPFSFGGMGVALFFVVSGFCIHLSFQQQGKDWHSFWIRRFFRIYPAYLAAIVFVLLFSMTNPQAGFHLQAIWGQLLTHLFLVHNLNPTTSSGLNASFWSLAVEAQLYLLYPLLLLLAGKFGWRRTMFVLAVCECSLRAASGVVDVMDAYNTTAGRICWVAAASPLGYWFSWALGALVAESFLKKQPFPFVRSPVVPWLILAFASYFIKPLVPFLFPLCAVITTIVISKNLSGAHSGIRLPQFFSNLLKKIALWSYSIYLLHQPLFYVYCLFIDWIFPKENVFHVVTFFLVAATWLIIIPFGALWYNLIEVPGIALGKQILLKRAARDPNRKEPFRQTLPPLYQSKRVLYLMVGTLVLAVAGSVFVRVKFSQLNSNGELALAEAYEIKHDYSDAIQHYHRSLELNKNSAIALNNTAWLLATAPDPDIRNGHVAVVLATHACKLSQYKEPVFIGTLAAADAEAGLFNEAIANAQKARALALAQGQTAIAEKNGQLIQWYKAGKAFHETPKPAP